MKYHVYCYVDSASPGTYDGRGSSKNIKRTFEGEDAKNRAEKFMLDAVEIGVVIHGKRVVAQSATWTEEK